MNSIQLAIHLAFAGVALTLDMKNVKSAPVYYLMGFTAATVIDCFK